jgi:hypothetical protein
VAEAAWQFGTASAKVVSADTSTGGAGTLGGFRHYLRNRTRPNFMASRDGTRIVRGTAANGRRHGAAKCVPCQATAHQQDFVRARFVGLGFAQTVYIPSSAMGPRRLWRRWL